MPLFPYMNILAPTPSVTPGPEWSQELNIALEVIDSHDHTSGKGVPIPAQAININENLSFQNNYLTALGAARMLNNGSALSNPLDITTIYAAVGELWYNDYLGNQVQITSGGSLNASSLGAIGGDYGASTALLAFYNLNETFVFTKDTNEAAPIDCGPVAIRDIAASANKITLKSPSGLVASYDVTLPVALPTTGKQLLQISSTGISSYGPTLPGSGVKLLAIDSNGDLTTPLTVSAGSITDLVNLTLTGTIATPISITLDNGVTDGGAVYFNGGTSSFLKSNAAGTDLQVAGFTTLSVLPVLNLGNGSSTTTTPDMLINSNTGDATIRLQVNNTSANAWDIKNDNSDEDYLHFEYNGTLKARISATGSNPITLVGTNLSEASAPAINHLYANSIIKAWGNIESTGSGTSLTRLAGFNFSTATVNTGSPYSITVTLHTAMANTNYIVLAQTVTGTTTVIITAVPLSTTQFNMYMINPTTGALANWNNNNGRRISFIVLGTQS